MRYTAAEIRAMGLDANRDFSDSELETTVASLLVAGFAIKAINDYDLQRLRISGMIRHSQDSRLPRTEIQKADYDFFERASLAFGFDRHDVLQEINVDEQAAIKLFIELRELIGADETLSLMRVIGSSSGRISRALRSMMRINFDTPQIERQETGAEFLERYQRICESQLPRFLEAIDTVIRRHLALGAIQDTSWRTDRNRTAAVEEISVGFVDLVGFTAFTEQADATSFIKALSTFESHVHEQVVDAGGTIVKMIGDEAMFVAPSPVEALQIASELSENNFSENGPKEVRIGLAHGLVLSAGGDYYGTVVNTASRIVEFAAPDTTVMTDAVAEHHCDKDQLLRLGKRSIRGLSSQVELYLLSAQN